MKTISMPIVVLLFVLATCAHAKDFALSWSRWGVVTQGVLLDSSTGLQWTQEDNGADISQTDALQYCRNSTWAGGGWRLPSVDELAAIYDADAAHPVLCKADSCKVSPLFRLTEQWFWSGTSAESANGYAQAWNVNLNHGSRLENRVSDRSTFRALCVRHS